MKLCHFLKSRAEIDECSRQLDVMHLPHHGNPCKDWDLAHVIPQIKEGNVLDMGSSDSFVLPSLKFLPRQYLKVGIDLTPDDRMAPGCAYLVGDMLSTGLPPKLFRNITCLSVIEHDVDFLLLAMEASSLLEESGRIYLTFDYWPTKIIQPMTMFGMKWNILSRKDVDDLIKVFSVMGLQMVENFDFSIGDAVITENYCGPRGCIPYTFGILTFVKI